MMAYSAVLSPYALNVSGGIFMDSENGTASNAIWAVAMIIIVAMIVGGVYYVVRTSGTTTPKKVDVDITVPAR